jgi:DtxR family Mn-dependent transcriptional regulator
VRQYHNIYKCDIVVEIPGMSHFKHEKLSAGHEEYLELIYRSEENKGSAHTSEMAAALGVGLGTITKVIDRLEKRGLVIHKPYRGVTLTAEGRKIGTKMLMRHRIIEKFLRDVLKINQNRLHGNACRLEHAVSDELMIAMKNFMEKK